MREYLHISQGEIISQAILHYSQEANVIEMIQSCKACGATIKQKYKIYHKQITVVQCDSCGLRFVAERFREDALTSLYDEILAKSDKHEKLRTERENLFNSWLDEIEHITGKSLKGLRLLDVGSGSGDFLLVARKRNCLVTGLDSSAVQVQKAKVMGIEMRECNIEHLPQRDHYDIITMWDVLEHVQDPKATIEAIYRLLVPGGILALSTPNGGSAWDLAGSGLYYASGGSLTFLVERRFSMGHLQIFRQDNLAGLLRNQGFRILKNEVLANYKSEFSRYLEQFLHNHVIILIIVNILKIMDRLHLLPRNKIILHAQKNGRNRQKSFCEIPG
jgi:2-polyprenyl-3-methyl-5-hydroxy-6-metoxy-1,4-benzoquinol methylase